MIKDRLEHASSYYGISENLKKGFEWLKNNDMQNIMDGKYVIDGDKLFANVQSYNTKEDAPLEGHRKYIDIQYMIKGVEKIGVVDYKNCSTIENYNEEKDIEFLKSNIESDYQILQEGDFLVFFPQDAHQPALDYNKKRFVKKVIVKVAV